MKKIMISVLVALPLIFCGCQKNMEPTDMPESTASEEPIQFETLTAGETQLVLETICQSETFQNQEGTLEFTVNIDQTVERRESSVIEVVPNYADGEDAKRIADVLVPGGEFFEAPGNADPPTKARIQNEIDLLTQFTEVDALQNLYGSDRNMDKDVSVIFDHISQLEHDRNKAPDIPQTPCDWTMKLQRVHFNLPEEIGNRPVEKDNLFLYAVTKQHDVEFCLEATDVRHSSNPSSTIRLNKNCQGGDFEDMVYRARTLRTDAPTPERIEELKIRAEKLLNQMGQGTWKAVEASVQESKVGDATEYLVDIRAVPMINGIPALREQRQGDGEYFMTSAYFRMSANGELYFFGLDGPMEVKEVLYDQVATLSLDELLNQAKEYMKNSGFDHDYGVPTAQFLPYTIQGEETFSYDPGEIKGRVNITNLEYGLGRVRDPERKDTYFYVPVLALYGSSEYYRVDSGMVIDKSVRYSQNPTRPMLLVSAVDGRIIGE